MHVKASLASATLVLLAGLALIAAAGFPSPASAGSAPPKVVTVVIREFEFEPATVTVHAGETVEWKNDDIVPHTATADSKARKPVFDSGTIDTGATWRYVARSSVRRAMKLTCYTSPVSQP